MSQFYYKNGKLYISEDEGKTGAALYPKKNGNITFGGTNYYKPKLHAKSINNSFTPVTEQQINTFRSKLNNNFFDAMKYASKEMQSTNPKKKINVTSSNSSTPSNSLTSPKRTQYQLPEGVKTRDDIIKIQQMLADTNMLNGTNKYNLGTYGAKGNGVDGIWGAKTDAAYKQYLKDQVDYNTNNIETEPIKVNTPFQLESMKGVRVSPDYSTPLMPSFNQFTLPWRNVWDDIKAGRRDSWIDYAKRGGIVRKFQEGNKFNFIKAEDIFKKTTDAIKEQDKKIQQVKKAASQPKRKSNNKVTTANTTAQLQLALYNAGMFDGIKKNGKQVSFEQAVDGLHGNLTNQAIKNAQKAGYNVDTNAGIITKNNKVTSQATNQTSSEVGQDFYDKISQSLRTLNNAREQDIIEQFKAREESRNKEFRVRFNPQKRLMDNMYPYSYGDVLYNPSTRETIPYTGQEIQEGWKLTQNWPTHNSNDELSDADKDFFVQSALGKITNAMKGKDPRRTHMELLNAVDLNSPGGLDRYNLYVSKAPQGMIRISGDPVNDQFESRAREDAAVFYNNHRQKYNTWEVNPEYMSPTARARGEATYRIADPKQRERIYGEMVNWWLANKNKGHWNEDHTAYIVPSMGFMGNHSLVSDDEKGTNLRYGDWWDYVIDAPNAHIMYMGDRLVPEGSIPKYNPKYGRGHNSEHRTEDFEDLKERMLDKVAPNPNYFNTNYASMMRGH